MQPLVISVILGELSFPSSVPPHPHIHIPLPLSPCALSIALARLSYTRTPMRRSSCPLECQVSRWDLLVLPGQGRSLGSQFQERLDVLA